MVMNFSWGWVKPWTVVTEPQAKVKPALARLAMPQAMRHPIARIRPGLERREQGLQVPAFRA
jgi:hypothetical protein